ncbi:hypothetical protein PENTCL1PPCAC_7519, partial [Pristionchus entomophagus]
FFRMNWTVLFSLLSPATPTSPEPPPQCINNVNSSSPHGDFFNRRWPLTLGTHQTACHIVEGSKGGRV